MDPNMTMANYPRGVFPPETPIAMAYVPIQKFGQVFEPETALTRGTVFPELDKPWLDGRAFIPAEMPGLMANAPAYPSMTSQPDPMEERGDKNE